MSESEGQSALVINAESLSKSYGERVIVRDVSLRVFRGDRVGIVGPNGAGKTTLVNLLTGRLVPDSGTLTLGASLALASLDQSRASLDPDTTLADTLTGGGGDTVRVGDRTRHVLSYMKDFLFAPNQAGTPVRILSGGERARLLLAKALATPSNLLVLDEPTNDLDLETLDLLQDMLGDYPGTVLLVSHDRDFLDRVATSVLMAEGDGRFVEYPGGYSDMVTLRGAGILAKAATKIATPKTQRASPPAASRKLSFKDKHALETLPAELTRLEKEIAAINQALSEADVYQRDPQRFAALSKALEQSHRRLEEAEQRWLELEILRETIENN